MEDVETTPLMTKDEASSARSSPWKKIGAVCLAGLALSGIAYTAQSKSNKSVVTTDFHDTDVDFKKYVSGADQDGWYIYKVAYVGKSGETETLLRFMTDHRYFVVLKIK